MDRTAEERLSRLERECRRWRLAGVATAMACGLALAVAAAPGDVPAVIRARRLEIVDGAGNVRVSAEASDALTGLSVQDADGNERATVGHYPDGAGVVNLWWPKADDPPVSIGVVRGSPILVMRKGEKVVFRAPAR